MIVLIVVVGILCLFVGFIAGSIYTMELCEDEAEQLKSNIIKRIVFNRDNIKTGNDIIDGVYSMSCDHSIEIVKEIQTIERYL